MDTKHHTWIECVLARGGESAAAGAGGERDAEGQGGRFVGVVGRWYVGCFCAACEASATSDIGMCSP